jgi:hypothetical protein
MSEHSRAVRAGTSQRELEVVLIIRARDPGVTLERVAGLSSIRGYQLRRRPAKRIHDVYFDTSEGLLGRKKMNLRIRKMGEDYWITWKRGPGLLGLWNRNERRELEVPWTKDSLSKMTGELARIGVKFLPAGDGAQSSPVETLRAMGLLVIQDRETNRQVREAMPTEGDRPLAELAIDSVEYHFQAQDVRLDEIEVEAGTIGGARVLEVLRDGLLELFREELEPWRWGKLVTGKMIERMLRKGSLEGLLEGSRLGPEAYGRLRSALETGSF